MPKSAAPPPPSPPFARRWTRRESITLGLLLIAPIVALVHLSGTINWRWLVSFFGLLNLATFLVYQFDKRRAAAGGRRIPEATLHLLEAAGAWPAAYLGQRLLRHKSAKRRFRIVFWLIVALHEAVAADYVLGWPLTRRILLALG